MKITDRFVCLCIIFIVTSCAMVSVEYDYDINANFADLKSYDWLSFEKSFGGDIQTATRESSLMEERIKTAVNRELKAKGLQIESENPDFYIAYYTGIEKEIASYSRFRTYTHSHSDSHSYSEFDIYQYDEEAIIVDFLDANSKKLLWRGVAKAATSKNMNPEKRKKLVNEAVSKMMENYPPKSMMKY